jgi:fermentation-respiration switch protein FrsA (DUF1100 family)
MKAAADGQPTTRQAAAKTTTAQSRAGQRGAARARLVVGVMVLAILAAAAAYLGAAVVTYDTVSRVQADCGGRFPGFTPAAWSTLRPTRSHPDATPLDPAPYLVPAYREVRFPSRDPGIALHAWWLPAAEEPQAPIVIIVPGRGSCIRDPDSLTPAGMLHAHGFGVLLVDLRDHGGSTIEDGRYAGGTEEYRDVQGAVDWLVAHGARPGHIGVFGTSMGAATAIIAAGQDERIAAAWEDSSYADVETRIAEELDQRGYPRLLAPAATLVARLVSGDDLASHTVLGELSRMRGRRLFIAHGLEDRATYVTHARAIERAAMEAGVGTETWLVPDAGHTDAMFLDPAAYEHRLAGFFGDALGS